MIQERIYSTAFSQIIGRVAKIDTRKTEEILIELEVGEEVRIFTFSLNDIDIPEPKNEFNVLSLHDKTILIKSGRISLYRCKI